VAVPVLLPTGFEVAATGIVSEHDAKNMEHTAKKSNNLFFTIIYFFLNQNFDTNSNCLRTAKMLYENRT
jgi:hypothetical protein